MTQIREFLHQIRNNTKLRILENNILEKVYNTYMCIITQTLIRSK
jgi:hypothetical protein